jgi:flavin-dependent dehydrogenase
LVRMARSVGAEVVEGNRLLGIQVQGHERMLVTTDGQDGISSLIARFVVAADGIHSPAARALGVRHHARWPKRLGLVAHFEDRCPAQTYEMHVGQGVYCGLATQPGGQVSAGLVVGMDEARKPDLGHGSFPTWALDRLPQVRRRLAGARQLGRVRGIGPMSRRVDRVSGPGFGLVGDAAGFLDPFTGEGLYRALHGAELITEAVDSGFRSGHTSTLVQARDYEQTRKKAFRSKEHLTFLIQLGLTQPAIFGAISSSIAGHEPARTRLGRVLGDIENARTLVDPRLLLGLAMARGS